MNKVILSGNISTPETKVSANGKEYYRFGLAVKKRSNGSETTQWFNCVAFEDFNLEKGQMLSIEGSIDISKSKDGDKQYVTILVHRLLEGTTKIVNGTIEDVVFNDAITFMVNDEQFAIKAGPFSNTMSNILTDGMVLTFTSQGNDVQDLRIISSPTRTTETTDDFEGDWENAPF